MLPCAALLFSVGLVAGAADEPAVLELTAANFSAVAGAPGAKVLVQFYAPWCSYCKRLAPAYEMAAARVRKARRDDPELIGRFAKVDATVELELKVSASQAACLPC